MNIPGLGSYGIHNDHLGTPVAMTDGSGAVVWSANYTPFGKAEIGVDTITNNFRFPGQYYDNETGLHYNYFRYYDPDTGRYITPDPIGLLGGINLYAYAGNNPLNAIDIFGLDQAICAIEDTIYVNVLINDELEKDFSIFVELMEEFMYETALLYGNAMSSYMVGATLSNIAMKSSSEAVKLSTQAGKAIYNAGNFLSDADPAY